MNNKGSNVHTIVRTLTVAITLAFASGAMGENYPSKPIRFIIDFPAGGVSDILARTVGQKLSQQLGQPLVYDNRPGANAVIAYELASRAPADGYTIALITTPFAYLMNLRDTLPYDTDKDFRPITLFALFPNLLVMSAKNPINTVSEFLARAKSKNQPVVYGSPGVGSQQHLTMELFRTIHKFQATHIPYTGSPPALVDLVGGRIEVMFTNIPGAVGHIRAGRVKALAIGSTVRSTALPAVPTFAEGGFPFETGGFGGAAAPARVNKSIIAKLNAEMVQALKSPDVQEQIRNVGGEPRYGTPDEFKKFISSETARWAPIIQQSGAKGKD